MLPTNQLGVVYCTPYAYFGPSGAMLLAQIRPLRVEFLYARQLFEIVAYSLNFDVIDKGFMAPTYTVSISDKGDGDITFTREQ